MTTVTAAAPHLIDPFQRAITYLRVSVTDRCDFRCLYCMAEEMTFLPKRDLLSLEELDRLCTTFIDLGVRKLPMGLHPLQPPKLDRTIGGSHEEIHLLIVARREVGVEHS